jgi:hypothetical protein
MKPLLAKVVGTRFADDDVLLRRMWLAIDWQTRLYAPAFLRSAGLSDAADLLASLPEVDSSERLKEAGPACKKASKEAARSAAEEAAKKRLAPIIGELQASAAELVLRMCAVKPAKEQLATR